MKVTAWKNVDVEVEVNVSLDECINEMLDLAEKDEPRLKIWAVDNATRVLEKVTPELVADVLSKNPEAIGILRTRLQKWFERTR